MDASHLVRDAKTGQSVVAQKKPSPREPNRLLKFLAIAAAATACITGPAHASDLHFFLNDVYVGDTLAFDLPSTPRPTSTTPDSTSFLLDVTYHDQIDGFVFDGASDELITFNEPDASNGFVSFTNGVFNLNGPQFFTGSLSSPAFAPGVSTLTDQSGEPWIATVSTITSAAPEPSTWALMMLGIGAIGASMRASRQRRYQAAPLAAGQQ